MITNEVLSAVLNLKKCRDIELLDSSLHYCFNKIDCSFINIHELAHKCKEWLYTNSMYEVIVNGTDVYLDSSDSLLAEGGFYYDMKFTADTEPEAVFKAAQWVLDKVSNV